MNRELLTFYGLNWNPFATDLPVDSLMTTPAVDSFCLRIERHLVRQGGFALIAGEPGAGKSVALRLHADRLGRSDGLSVAAITHPSSRLPDTDGDAVVTRAEYDRALAGANMSNARSKGVTLMKFILAAVLFFPQTFQQESCSHPLVAAGANVDAEVYYGQALREGDGDDIKSSGYESCMDIDDTLLEYLVCKFLHL